MRYDHNCFIRNILREISTNLIIPIDYPEKDPINNDMAKVYLLHLLKAGTSEERQLILSAIKTKFILTRRELRMT
jgi:hypothetical protein